jgi:hypothetical protein
MPTNYLQTGKPWTRNSLGLLIRGLDLDTDAENSLLDEIVYKLNAHATLVEALRRIHDLSLGIKDNATDALYKIYEVTAVALALAEGAPHAD